MTTPVPAFVFLDLETTGLDQVSDVILEIGMILTDSDLNELATFNRVINWQPIRYDRETDIYEPPFGIHKTVTDMHTLSHLWMESYRSAVTLRQALADAIFWLDQQCFDVKEKLPLVGNTIGFDRSFLYEVAPKFLDLFHYRSVDISSIKILYKMWVSDEDDPNKPVGNKMHRSVPDCLDSINELRYYKKVLFNRG